jgi:hypothetical protein
MTAEQIMRARGVRDARHAHLSPDPTAYIGVIEFQHEYKGETAPPFRQLARLQRAGQ